MIHRRFVLKILAASPLIAWLGYRSLGLSSATGAAQPATSTASTSTPPAKLRLYSAERHGYITSEKVIRTETEWKEILTPEQFTILRLKGTERPFTGKYSHNEEKGIYKCAGCENDLFSSKTKFDSGTGWPSFYAPIAPENVRTESDSSHMMERNEVLCARCDGHLGHVFDDGPKPTGLRYCMNSASLLFVKAK